MALLPIGSFVFCYQFDATYLSTTFIPAALFSFALIFLPLSLSLSLFQFSHVHDGGTCEIKKEASCMNYQEPKNGTIIKIKEIKKLPISTPH